MNEYLEDSGKAISESVRRDVTEHFRQLQRSHEEYFPPYRYIIKLVVKKSFHLFIPDIRTLSQGI